MIKNSIKAPKFITLKKAVSSILCHPIIGYLLGKLFSNSIPHRGCRIKTPTDGNARVNSTLFWGIYESAEIRFIEKYLSNDLDVVEIGSSIGGVSSSIADKLLPNKKLICLEANKRIIPLLIENLANNASHLDVHVITGAIDYSGEEQVTFSIGDTNLSGHLIHESIDSTNSLMVPAYTLQDILNKEKIHDYALVSDIEGAEASLFSCERKAFDRCKQIIIELHDTVHEGNPVNIDFLIQLIKNNAGMELADRYGSVCCFLKDNRKSSDVNL